MATEINRKYTVTTNSLPLRIRSGPGTSYKVLGNKSKGSIVHCTKISDDGKWAYNVDAGGWMSLEYLTVQSVGDFICNRPTLSVLWLYYLLF